MIEELEGVKSSGTKVNEVSELSNKELDYLKECIAPPRPDSLALRIDELQNSTPPKALDSNPQIAEIIEPIKDKIPSKYLEAPTDMELINNVIEGIKDGSLKEAGILRKTSFE